MLQWLAGSGRHWTELTVFHKLEPTKVGEDSKGCRGRFVCCTSRRRYVAIECKATDQDRFAQVSRADRAPDAVPMSFLVDADRAEMFFAQERRAIPWETLGTAESVTTDRLRAWRCAWMGVRSVLCFDADGE